MLVFSFAEEDLPVLVTAPWWRSFLWVLETLALQLEALLKPCSGTFIRSLWQWNLFFMSLVCWWTRSNRALYLRDSFQELSKWRFSSLFPACIRREDLDEAHLLSLLCERGLGSWASCRSLVGSSRFDSLVRAGTWIWRILLKSLGLTQRTSLWHSCLHLESCVASRATTSFYLQSS